MIRIKGAGCSSCIVRSIRRYDEKHNTVNEMKGDSRSTKQPVLERSSYKGFILDNTRFSWMRRSQYWKMDVEHAWPWRLVGVVQRHQHHYLSCVHRECTVMRTICLRGSDNHGIEFPLTIVHINISFLTFWFQVGNIINRWRKTFWPPGRSTSIINSLIQAQSIMHVICYKPQGPEAQTSGVILPGYWSWHSDKIRDLQLTLTEQTCKKKRRSSQVTKHKKHIFNYAHLRDGNSKCLVFLSAVETQSSSVMWQMKPWGRESRRGRRGSNPTLKPVSEALVKPLRHRGTLSWALWWICKWGAFIYCTWPFSLYGIQSLVHAHIPAWWQKLLSKVPSC